MERLAECTLDNGVLRVPGLHGRELAKFCDELWRKFMLYEIEFYKPVGVYVTSSVTRFGVGDSNVTTKIFKTSESYLELFKSLSQLIYASVGSLEEEKQSNSGVIVTRIGDNVASSNGSLVVQGMGASGVPESLLPDVHILTRVDDTVNMNLFCYKSHGFLSFQEVSSLLPNSSYVPIAQLYDLTESLFIKRPEVGDDAIYFKYKKRINERVLEQILKNNAV